MAHRSVSRAARVDHSNIESHRQKNYVVLFAASIFLDHCKLSSRFHNSETRASCSAINHASANLTFWGSNNETNFQFDKMADHDRVVRRLDAGDRQRQLRRRMGPQQLGQAQSSQKRQS
jgi:hypothetical protein